MSVCTKHVLDLFVNAICMYQSSTEFFASRHGEREKIIREENACTKHIRDLFVNATFIFVISKNEILLWYND